MSNSANDFQSADDKSRVKLFVFALLAVLVGGAYYWFDPEQMVRYKDALDEAREEQPLLTYGGAFVVYVVVTGISLPGAAVLSLLYASLFGFWRSVLLISFASTCGATVAFLLARYLLHDVAQAKFGRYLARFNDALTREGAFYLFTLRLIPAVPFFMINLVMGLTPLRARTFWWVSQVGMLPGTCAYCFAGSRLEVKTIVQSGLSSVLSWDVLLAFAILGIFPLAVKRLMNWARSRGPRPRIE